MCRMFAGIPVASYESETRSLRLGRHSTSIRLEAAYWQLLEELAGAEKLPLARFLTTLYTEVLDLHGEVRNFASLLRCVCLLHLERVVEGADGSPTRASSRAMPQLSLVR